MKRKQLIIWKVDPTEMTHLTPHIWLLLVALLKYITPVSTTGSAYFPLLCLILNKCEPISNISFHNCVMLNRCISSF